MSILFKNTVQKSYCREKQIK